MHHPTPRARHTPIRMTGRRWVGLAIHVAGASWILQQAASALAG